GHHHQISRAVVAAAAYRRHSPILVPVGASLADVRATRRDMAPILSDARKLVDWELRVRTVLMRYDPRQLITATAREALAADPIVAPPSHADIQSRTIYTHTLETGRGVCELEPGGAAAAEIAALATETAELALTEPVMKEARQ
ncbi:hypothetical protein ACFQV6_44160, partial [Actinoplanes sp. GCM10030250]